MNLCITLVIYQESGDNTFNRNSEGNGLWPHSPHTHTHTHLHTFSSLIFQQVH